MGICFVRSYRSNLWHQPCENVGLVIQNVFLLPSKKEATESEIVSCGVTIDKIRSCIRQQINGYVSDLNSVCGVMPVNAEEEIRYLLDILSKQVD